MILGGIDLKGLGLNVSYVAGLWDFPKNKKEGIDWPDSNKLEAFVDKRDFTFKERTFTVECFVSGSTYSEAKTKLNTIATALNYDGLKKLMFHNASSRAYMVYMWKNTISKPYPRHFQDGQTILEFKLSFREPQPFNVQLNWELEYSLPASIRIEGDYVGIDRFNVDVKGIYVCLDDDIVYHDLESGDMGPAYTWSGVLGVGKHNLLIYGDIDRITLLQVSPVAINQDTASLFLRSCNVTN